MTISDDDFANLSVMPEEPVERIKYLLAAAEQAVALAQRFRRERNEAQILGRAFRDALVLAQRERDEEQQACDRLRALLREARNYLGDDADLNARIDAALEGRDG